MQTIDFSSPLVMGILNTTPDSFFDGGIFDSLEKALAQVRKMVEEGATIIDIGGYSSRPGATNISEEEEIKRVIPVLKAVKLAFPTTLISVDTFRSKVAQVAIDEGADIINDISGGTQDPALMDVVAQAKVYYVLMHMRGTSQTMQGKTSYHNLVEDVIKELNVQLDRFSGDTSKIIIDPGFGFAKTLEQNYELLAQMEKFKKLGSPLLVGISRKSMIYKKLGITPAQALNGTTALHAIAIQKGANILRAHDVQEAKETITLVQATIL